MTECCICYEYLDAHEMLIEAISCGHQVHNSCMQKWVQSQQPVHGTNYKKACCPMCRTHVPEYDQHDAPIEDDDVVEIQAQAQVAPAQQAARVQQVARVREAQNARLMLTNTSDHLAALIVQQLWMIENLDRNINDRIAREHNWAQQNHRGRRRRRSISPPRAPERRPRNQPVRANHRVFPDIQYPIPQDVRQFIQQFAEQFSQQYGDRIPMVDFYF